MNEFTRTLTLPYAREPEGVVFRIGQYFNGETAIQLFGVMGELLMTVTVNLEAEGVHPADGCFLIKDYSENAGIADLLASEGIIELTGRETSAGPFGARVVEARWAESVSHLIESDE